VTATAALLEGRSAIVFGGSGRVGTTIARTLFASGARVGIHYFSNQSKAEALAHSLDPAGKRALSLQADCTDEKSLQALVQKVKETFGSVDIVVNTVHAPFQPVLVADAGSKDWQVHQEALLSHFLICKSVIPSMREQQYGRIIFISAGLAVRYSAGMSLFSTVKKGLNGFCQSLAREEGSHNILVNVVAPGAVEDCNSETAEEWEKLGKLLLANSALGRFATSQEVANAALFFASPLADGITGQVLFVCGGEIMV
jgi:3-oxoacyl-[acyl-carrier protein] reductase